jgi:hypothetical protein
MKILFTGDLFTGGQLDKFDGQTRIGIKAFNQADIRIVNLEQATSDNTQVVHKSTVHAPLDSLKFLTENKVNIVSLANNHIQDKGQDGFVEGLDELEKRRIKFLGAGLSIKEAEQPIELTDDLVIIAYCDYNKPYLKKIEIAADNDYGVNPFSYEKVIKDVEKIPDGKQVILCLHWGKENVWFPPSGNIKTARKLLDHPKVHSIIGSHSHRMQGKINHNGKYAFFSLGNFLFPNFYLMPRTQMVYPATGLSNVKTTKEYHPVFSLTKKVWKYSNRVSIMLVLENNNFKEVFVKQNKSMPIVLELVGIERMLVKLWFSVLTYAYGLPSIVYVIIKKPFNIVSKLAKYFNIAVFYFVKERKIQSLINLMKKQFT